jgi:hypothetical protein
MLAATKSISLTSQTRSLILGAVWLILAVGIAIAQFANTPTIEITWKTASEFDTAGFNVYRSDRQDQGYLRLNDDLIHGKADSTIGAEYIFIDNDVLRGMTYYYRLEDVEYDNSATLHETIAGRADYFENWAFLLIGICIVVGISFLVHGIRSKPRAAT